jgi:hypothetical protein
MDLELGDLAQDRRGRFVDGDERADLSHNVRMDLGLPFERPALHLVRAENYEGQDATLGFKI